LDRLFWVGLSHVWDGWRQALDFVQPDTVIRWQRERFRRYWARLSQQGGRPRRPAVADPIRQLVLQIATANQLWRAPRIHGELKMLGVTISERTVSRILRTIRRPRPSQTWKTFLRNHLGQIVSVDFFTVATIRLQVLFVFVVLEHRRRQVLHCNVTDHSTSAWVAQQIVEAFANRSAPRYLIRDRCVYGTDARLRLQSLGIKEVLTKPQSPWQNGYAERLIGSIRRECLNHVVVMNAKHLKRILAAYFRYYHRSRTHLALEKQCPTQRRVMEQGTIVEIAEVGGLHHRYGRIAA
jgi:transposase InsO family protein